MIDPANQFDLTKIPWGACFTTLAGAIAGFISAMVMEVWKQNRTEKKNAHKMRRALYVEITGIYSTIRGLLDYFQSPQDPRVPLSEADVINYIKGSIRMDAYKYAKQNPLEFYSLREAEDIDAIYILFPKIYDPQPQDKPLWTADHITEIIAYAIREKKIDERLFKNASPTAYERALEHGHSLPA
jgi:hypothetical protein